MKEKIREHINDPERLEQLYRADRQAFESGFKEACSGQEESELLGFWKLRLDYSKRPGKIKKISLADIGILISACLITGFLVKIPDLLNIAKDDSVFYMRNTGLIVFFGLIFYAALTDRIHDLKRLAFIIVTFLVLTVYVNLLPSAPESDTVNLVYIHLPLLMWCIYGLVYIDFSVKDKIKRIEYIRYNGDLAILMAIMVIAGGILTGITIGLFDAIGINIENFYMENIVITGAVSVPIVATYIIKSHPALTSRIAPVIAGIFSPLVLITAIIYLIALAFSGKDPYSDREFLLIFNIMLVGVMAVIVFSVSGTSITRKQRFSGLILFILSIVTVIIDLIALSAIFYRLGAFGITPNRLAVLGSNILILVNLVLIIIDLYKVSFRKAPIREVELTVAKYLPVYLAWILIVIFAFPLVFGVR